MKARNNKTGEIVDIEDMSIVTYKESDGTYVKTLIKNFTFIDAEKDYYTKLKHQYAGMAMQGLIASGRLDIELSYKIAHTLVEELKKKECE